jgi:hypothetical protein
MAQITAILWNSWVLGVGGLKSVRRCQLIFQKRAGKAFRFYLGVGGIFRDGIDAQDAVMAY